MQIRPRSTSENFDESSRESSPSTPRTPLDADGHFLHANMNQSIVQAPLYSQNYSLPSDSDCIDQLGHAGSIPYTNGGVSNSPRRSSDLNQSSSLVRPLGHRSSNDQVFHSQQSIPEASSGSISNSPSSNNSSVPFSYASHQRGQHFSPTHPIANTTNPFPYSQALPSTNLLYNTAAPFGGMTTRLTDHTQSYLPSHRSSLSIGNPVSPNSGSSVRDRYTTSIPETGKYFSAASRPGDIYRSPQYINTSTDPSRYLSSTFTMAPTHYTSGTTAAYPSTQATDTPPFSEQEVFHTILGQNHEAIKPTIEAKIEKGFFISGDSCWTCYRRNYFSVQCSYTLSPHTAGQPLYLQQTGSTEMKQIQAMAMTLTAAVDGAQGKPIELVQHTPKRDKGPQTTIQMTKLCPTPPGGKLGHLPHAETHGYGHPHSMLGFNGGSSSISAPFLPMQSHQEPGATHPDPSVACHNQPTSPTAHQHTFERIQFKSATANNGKRRAQQQYYHLIVELHADVRSTGSSQAKWVKVGHRSSSQVVVRGRSPSHYSNEGPHTSASRGGGAASGGGSGGYYGMSLSGPPMASTRPAGYGGYSGGSYRGNQYAMEPTPLSSHSVSTASSVSGGQVDSYAMEHHPAPMILNSHGGDDHRLSFDGLPPIYGSNSIFSNKVKEEYSIFPSPGRMQGGSLRIPAMDVPMHTSVY